MHSHLFALVPVMLLAGCQSLQTNYAGPSTKSFSEVKVSAVGLKQHAAVPNDMLWLHLVDSSTSAPIGAIKITHDEPVASFAVDHDKPLIMRFSSIEAHFGGYTHCGAEVPLTARTGEKYSILFTTHKWRCSVEAKRATGEGGFATVANVEGRAGGTQYRATLMP